MTDAMDVVRVKPLVFTKSCDGEWDAYCILGVYSVTFSDGVWGWMLGDHFDYETVKGDEREAMAAAQAHFSARVISAVEPRDVTVQEAAKVILADRFGGYGNRMAMQAMWEFIYKERDRHPFPVSFYDGALQSAHTALSQDVAEGDA